jgi:hypothetical protein
MLEVWQPREELDFVMVREALVFMILGIVKYGGEFSTHSIME